MPPTNTTLTKEQSRYLRGLCHHLNPVVMIASKGLTDNVMNELETALDHHELIKVKVRTERAERQQLLDDICSRTQAEVVQSIGHTACLFRRNRKAPRIALP